MIKSARNLVTRRFDQLAGRLASSPIVINSVPKAGTHLLEKAVRLMPGCYPANIHIDQFTWPDFKTIAPDQTNSTRARKATIGELEQTLHTIQAGHYATAHFVFQQDLADLMVNIGIRILFIVRDPRDIALSFAKYVSRNQVHFLYEYFQTLSEEERIMTSIVGTVDRVAQAPRQFNIKVQVNNMLPWRWQPNVYTTKFEQLIGEAGGGSNQEQFAELSCIANHIGVHCSTKQLRNVASQLFGGTATFRKGSIGDWRTHFTHEHKQAFKDIAGQMLIDLGYENDFNW